MIYATIEGVHEMNPWHIVVDFLIALSLRFAYTFWLHSS